MPATSGRPMCSPRRLGPKRPSSPPIISAEALASPVIKMRLGAGAFILAHTISTNAKRRGSSPA